MYNIFAVAAQLKFSVIAANVKITSGDELTRFSTGRYVVMTEFGENTPAGMDADNELALL